MRNLNVRRLAPSAMFGVMALLSASAMDAQIDYSNFDIRQARDVAVGPTGNLWMIGHDGSPNGSIHRLLASGLVAQPAGAVRIAVDPSGNAWIVNSSGRLYHWEKAGTAPEAWVLSNLKAMDVAVGANGAVWAVGADHRIMRLSNGVWTAISGGGDRIAVDPAGNPWVVNSNNDIWHWTGTEWISVPGKAQDVSVAPDGTVFIVGMTPKPGGFQILRRTGSTWTEIPGAAGVAVAATSSRLSLAQLPQSSQVVAVNVPVITQGQTVSVNPVPVINQPTTIALQGTTSIPVSGPSGTTSPTPTKPPVASSSTGLRRIFVRDQTYEAQILKALNYGTYGTRIFLNGQVPPASTLPPLDRGFAHLAMAAAEAMYSQQPDVTADQVLSQVGSVPNPTPRRALNGILSLLLVAKMSDRSTDPETIALRRWVTDVYRNQRVLAAKASLDEYLKWKQDPCGYEGKAAGECMTMANLFTTRTPPQTMIGERALGTMLAGHRSEILATTGVLFSASVAAMATAITASTLGVVVVPAAGASAPVYTSLFAAFGGLGKAAGPGAAIAGGWAGVAAAPVAAAIMAVVVGTIEGFKVVEAARVEPMLRLKLGAAMTEDIVIENALSDQNAVNFFYLAFQNAAANRFAVPPNTVDGEVRFYNQGGFVARFTLEYTLNGRPQTHPTPALPVGHEATFAIPAAATRIVASGEWLDLVVWKSLFQRAISRPTFIGYTAYGTALQPSVKDEYPEVSNIIAKAKELTVTQGGGYVARVRVTYRQGNKDVVAIDNSDLFAGWRQVFTIPSDATNIHLMAWTRTGLVWEPWKGIIDKIWPSPPNECIKVFGTTLEPRWNNECR